MKDSYYLARGVDNGWCLLENGKWGRVAWAFMEGRVKVFEVYGEAWIEKNRILKRLEGYGYRDVEIDVITI